MPTINVGGLPEDPNDVPPPARPSLVALRDQINGMIEVWSQDGSLRLPPPREQAEELLRVYRAYTAPIDPRIKPGVVVRQKPGLSKLTAQPGYEGAIVLVVWRVLDPASLDDANLIATTLTEHHADVDCLVAAHQQGGQTQVFLHHRRCLEYDERLNG